MTTNKDDINLFNSEVLAEKNINGIIYRIYKNRIYHVIIPRYEKVDLKVIDNGYRFLEDYGGGKFYNIFQFGSFADIEPNIRDWAADEDGNLYTHSDAIVIESLSQKIIADFYLRFNKPAKPTKIFYSIEKAIEWTHAQIKKNTI